MHSKNNNKTLPFIQGLRPFSSSIPKTLKKHLRKSGYNYSNIVDNWTKMVSKKISDACYPITVKMGKDMKDGNLVLNVMHGKEMEVEYEKNEIMEYIILDSSAIVKSRANDFGKWSESKISSFGASNKEIISSIDKSVIPEFFILYQN